MLDFTDRDIYEREKGRMQDFLNKKLITQSERDTQIIDEDGGGDGIGIIDTDSYMGGEAVDFGGDSFDEWDESAVTKSRELDLANDRRYEQGVWWKDLLYAPWFLFFYVGRQLFYDPPNKEEWRDILESLNKVTIFSAVTAIIMWIFDLNFVVSSPFQAITSGIMFVMSTLILKYVYGEKKEAVEEDDIFSGSVFDGYTDDDEALGFGGGDLSLGGDEEEFSLGLGIEDVKEVVEEVDSSGRHTLAPSPIDISDDKLFDRGLLGVYAGNSIYAGTEITNRKELLESFAGYIVTNDRNYGEWRILAERTIEYNNIVYSLFKGLGQMHNAFLTDDEKIIVTDMRSNPLLYKIEVELPPYFKERSVQSNLYEIENILKQNEDDMDVSVTSGYSRGMFVFKFLRLDNRNLISLGDILRFYDETKGQTALEIFADEKKGLPVLLGLRGNEHPYVLDFEANTSGTIVGGSGSGKSWLTFLLMFNLVLANDYNNVQFIILDVKNAPFWNQFAKFPHVLGYHTKYDTYLEIMREVYEEVNRRKALMNELDAEDVKGLRERLRRDKDYEGLKRVPLLTVVIDEITSTMQELKVMYEEEIERYNEIRGIIDKITQEGRFVGVRLMMIGQRSVDSSISKSAMFNSTFKFGMRMEADTEFEFMFGKEVNRLPKPKGMGMGLARTMEEPGIYMIKTLTVGGANNDQVLRMIRVLALEWVRRSKGLDNIIQQPTDMKFELTYNRDKFATESYKDIEEGRILSRNSINEGFTETEIQRGYRPPTMQDNENYEKDEDDNSLYDYGDGDGKDCGEEDYTNYEEVQKVEEPVQMVSRNEERNPNGYDDWGDEETVNVLSGKEEKQDNENQENYGGTYEDDHAVPWGSETEENKRNEVNYLDGYANEIGEPEVKAKEASYVEDDDDDIFDLFNMGDIEIKEEPKEVEVLVNENEPLAEGAPYAVDGRGVEWPTGESVGNQTVGNVKTSVNGVHGGRIDGVMFTGEESIEDMVRQSERNKERMNTDRQYRESELSGELGGDFEEKAVNGRKYGVNTDKAENRGQSHYNTDTDYGAESNGVHLNRRNSGETLEDELGIYGDGEFGWESSEPGLKDVEIEVENRAVDDYRRADSQERPMKRQQQENEITEIERKALEKERIRLSEIEEERKRYIQETENRIRVLEQQERELKAREDALNRKEQEMRKAQSAARYPQQPPQRLRQPEVPVQLERQDTVKRESPPPTRGVSGARMSLDKSKINNEQAVTDMSIKEYIIKNGEQDGLMNRKIRCEDLEKVYPKYKLEQAMDMMVILRTGNWYISRL